MNDQIQLSGDRIYLRRLTPEDVTQRYIDWLNDPAINRYLETRFCEQDRKKVLSFVKEKTTSRFEYLFGIFLHNENRHIGNIKIGPVNQYHRFAPISLFIGDKESWGKGFATEAIDLVVRFSFEELKLKKLEAGCYKENIGSRRAFEKCGFSVEGILKNRREVEGKRSSDILLGLAIEDWEQEGLSTSR